MTQESRGRRLGNVFSVRITPAERDELEKRQRADVGPRSLGPYLVWRALQSTTRARARAGNTGDGGSSGTTKLAAPPIHQPQWWALENPVGLLGHYLGEPRDVFQPCDFGETYTKRTALWGRFALPARRYARPTSRMRGRTKAARALTPATFARAFFEANP